MPMSRIKNYIKKTTEDPIFRVIRDTYNASIWWKCYWVAYSIFLFFGFIDMLIFIKAIVLLDPMEINIKEILWSQRFFDWLNKSNLSNVTSVFLLFVVSPLAIIISKYSKARQKMIENGEIKGGVIGTEKIKKISSLQDLVIRINICLILLYTIWFSGYLTNFVFFNFGVFGSSFHIIFVVISLALSFYAMKFVIPWMGKKKPIEVYSIFGVIGLLYFLTICCFQIQSFI